MHQTWEGTRHNVHATYSCFFNHIDRVIGFLTFLTIYSKMHLLLPYDDASQAVQGQFTDGGFLMASLRLECSYDTILTDNDPFSLSMRISII